jgi:molybdate transport system permease protein
MSDLWQPLRLSLLIATAATLVVAVVGIGLAHLAARSRWFLRTLIDAALTLPLVLPPTVVGYVLIVLLGKHGWVGGPLFRWTGGYTVLFRPEGGVIAAAVVALPLLYLPARAAFAGVDPDLEAAARLSGADGFGLFWHVSLPLARRGIASGLLLAFARAIGEFGATDMVMANFNGRQTLPIAIYNRTLNGDLGQASSAVWVLTGLSLAIVLLYNRLPGGR